MNKIYMLDTNICSFIMREQPEALLKHLEQSVLRGHRIVVSAITYSEMRFGATGPKA
ncbi:TPA: type II toxin-antitoxin system VapC family toxin, partial [Escherichia coli]